jgi:uncharacterized protein YecE (DUF72 family)
MGEVRVGVSGWAYEGWRGGAFYPESLPRTQQLAYLSRLLPSVEINRSFYALLSPQAYHRYHDETPDGFLFAVKGSRFITHMKRLVDVAVPLANFFASGVLRLEEKLGPVLWQFPAAMRWEPERMKRFLELLPADTVAASRLARRHDHRVRGRASMVVQVERPLRHAFELRDPDMLCEEAVRLFRSHDVALVCADSGDWPYTEELTASFVYARLHGSPHTYASEYDAAALRGWAAKVRRWSTGQEAPRPSRITRLAPPARRSRDVFVYFDNDARARAPWNALDLARELGVAAPAAFAGR